MKYEPNPNSKCTCDNPRHHTKWILNEKGIVRSIKAVLVTGNIEKLTKDAYSFVMNMSGFIAHYSRAGFMDYYRNTEDLRRDILQSSDTSDYKRYITDSYFSEGEQKDYYAAEARVLRELGDIAKQTTTKSQNREEELIKDKVNLLTECMERAKTDQVFAKQILQKLQVI